MSKTQIYQVNYPTPASVPDEPYLDLGASEFQLGFLKRTFKGGADLVIRTASGGGGTLLVETTDYTLTIDVAKTAAAVAAGQSYTVYSGITITNVTYQTGTLYFTYKTPGSYTSADWANTLQESSSGFFRQMLLNGDFRIAQERTSSTVLGEYVCDQWKHEFTATSNTFTQNSSQAWAPPFNKTAALSFVMDSGEHAQIVQYIPAYRTKYYRNKTAQLRFRIINLSLDTGSVSVECLIQAPQNTDNWSAGIDTLITTDSLLLDGTDQTYSAELDLSTVGGSGYTVQNGMNLIIRVTYTGTTGTGSVHIGDVQINEGDVALPFQPRDDFDELLSFFQKVAMYGESLSTNTLPTAASFKAMFKVPSIASFDSGPSGGNVDAQFYRVGTGSVAITITASNIDEHGVYSIVTSGQFVTDNRYTATLALDARID